MLAGLLLALHDADDRPGVLTATLPFGGLTLIEFQARLLIAAGASQIVVIGGRLTPELLGALSRIGRRGVAVDTVRSASEAAEKVHPLARVVMLADGLTTSPAVVETMVSAAGDALLVVRDDEAGRGFERIGGGMNWAGIAQLGPRRLAELAAMPRDYDIQSTLVRLASQAGALHVALPDEAFRQGHGIEHAAGLMEVRSRTVLGAVVSTRRGWFDRLVVNPIARLAIVPLVRRAVPTLAVLAAASVTAAAALAGIWLDHPVIGFVAAIVAGIMLALAGLLADLRDEPEALRFSLRGAKLLPTVAMLFAGYRYSTLSADHGAIAVAVAAVVACWLVERARPKLAPDWWGTPPAYLPPALIGAVVGLPVAGLIAAACYATATLAALVERNREQP